MKKGEVETKGGFTMTCVGAYWDWPWWKRGLSTLARLPYGWFAMERGRFLWRHIPDNSTTKQMGRDFYLETYKSLVDSHIRPIFWELERDETLPTPS